MKKFTIFWTGTITGTTEVEAETIEEAIYKAENPLDFPDVDESIEIETYPDDWMIERYTTIGFAMEAKWKNLIFKDK